jgi:hypothetical protein
MLIDILFYLGMSALALLGAGTVLSIAHVALPAWFVTLLSAGWLSIVLGWLAWMILPWLASLLGPRR